MALESLINEVLLPTGYADEEALSRAETYLSPAAKDLVSEWAFLHNRLRNCFITGIIFFVCGALSSVVLLLMYITREKYAESFQTKLMARSSLTSAVIAAGSLVNGSFLNALSQDRLGYATVKRDSAICFLLFYGIPMIGVAAAALAGFNCQHRTCYGYGYKDASLEYYTVFCIVVTTPVVWWQFLSLLTASVAVRSAQEELKDGGVNKLPTDPQELDALEPPIGDKGVTGLATAVVALVLSLIKWILQLILLLALFWNSPLATRTIGGRAISEWGDAYVGESFTAAIDLGNDMYNETVVRPTPLVGEIDSGYFTTGIFVWVLGMLLNVFAVGIYMACKSTAVLRKAVEERLALTAFTFTCATYNPEAMRALADRRADVYFLRKLGALPALVMDLPIVILSVRFLVTYGWNTMVLFVGAASLAHGLIYLSRAIVVALTATLRRTPYVPDVANGEPPFYRATLGDVASMFASMLQLGLLCALLGVYYHGYSYGLYMGFTEDEARACNGAFWALSFIIIAYLIANLCCSISFLNHFTFSHENIAEKSYRSGLCVVLSLLDGAWLNLIAEETVAVREVKRAASFVAIGTNFVPALLLQGVMLFMANVPFGLLDTREDDSDWEEIVETASGEVGYYSFLASDYLRMMSAGSVANLAMACTVLVGVWKLLLLVILHTTRLKAEESPFVHTPFVGGAQWLANRSLPEGFDDESRRARLAAKLKGNGPGKPTHHMGYAIDANGQYIFDRDGQYTLGPGVQYVFDQDGNYSTDEWGNAMLEDADGVLITEGYGRDGDGYGATHRHRLHRSARRRRVLEGRVGAPGGRALLSRLV